MKSRLTLKVLTASILLASCAQTQTKPTALNIQPLQKVQHSYEQAKAQYDLGRYYHGQLRYRQAIEAYRQALAINPDMVSALNAMGAAYAESGDLVLARQQFEAAQKLQPSSVNAYNNLGFVNYLAGAYEAAIDALKQALRIDAGDKKARENLVLAFAKMGRGEQIARTDVPDAAVTAQHSMEKETQQDTRTAWVEISPSIYAMHIPAAREAQSAETQLARQVDSVPVTQMATAEAAPAASPASVASVAVPQVAAISPASSAQQIPVVAQRVEAQPAAIIVADAVPVVQMAKTEVAPVASSSSVASVVVPHAAPILPASSVQQTSVVAPRAEVESVAIIATDVLPVAQTAKAVAVPVKRSASFASVLVPRAAKAPPVSYVQQIPVVAKSVEAKSFSIISSAEAAPLSAVSVPKVEQGVHGARSLKGVEVSNGNGIRGLAARVSRYFSFKGVKQARLTNQRPFAERRTRIEYRPGSEMEAARINKLLPHAAPLVASNSLRSDIRVRLVLGHDLQRAMTALDSGSGTGTVTVAGMTGRRLPNI